MEKTIKDKILLFDALVKKVEELKKEGKTVVQSHGIYDIIHPGIIKHLNEARKQGDVLIVTVVKDEDVRRGPGRPIFAEELRAENVASLDQVDYTCLVDDEISFECVKKIKPDIFAKGQAYKERDRKIHERIFEEEKELYFGKSSIYETSGFSFSSSHLINNFLQIYPEETKYFLREFLKRYTFQEIFERLNSFKDLKVLIIGDGIIDEYCYCESMSRSAKTPIVVNKYLTHEVFAGAAFIIANHIAGLCNEVQLVTLLGREDSREAFILDSLKPNIRTKFFYRDDGPTIVKRRYINQYNNQKLFEVNYINDTYINKNCESEIIGHLKSVLPQYDIVLVSDFGHGFITKNIIDSIEESSKTFAVNTQTNAANAGYNLITKYKNPNFVCLDEAEARLAVQEKFADIEDVAKKIMDTVRAEYLIITMGKKGSVGIDNRGIVCRTPIFSTKVIDTVGAGDAFFAFTAPCFAKGMPLDFVSFIGNAVGALAVQIVGNKKPVEKHELLEFVHSILK
ncbi:MAG: PfkB family carbohydrate kinase [Proteobacteria bacterium]|nr:PfkB family carbohydrate kinase [Pseudomonadota bacterium]